ncbi:MAG: deoxyguanosinetriphosphate triphosphohydrolase [Firmicutes bacterium]|nr:deoxyguanosinetriphosphate triphosphohydrolase [Bacillota bacterium]
MRIDWEKKEYLLLSEKAMHADKSRGRSIPEEECPMRTCYQRDRDRIIHSKSFRRLKHKTQVFVAPKGDHFRTRMTHTLEVMQIARTIARALSLNEDLTEAIAFGHDLGHTPFGHAGERTLQLMNNSFSHNSQSIRVVELLERDGQGLNLTAEVKDGILNHTGDGLPFTLEGQIVRIADRIGYVNHDIDDALRAGLITINSLPKKPLQLFGERNSERINAMVLDMIKTSEKTGKIGMSEQAFAALMELRDYLFKNVYLREEAMEEEGNIREKILQMYAYFKENPQEMRLDYRDANLDLAVCDYISGMTDNYAFDEYERLKEKF